jgi:hypothetical protein
MVVVSIVIAAVSLAVSPAVAAASNPHWCKQGDPPLYASAGTSCALAGDIITSYVNGCHESRSCRMPVYAPSARRGYRITCDRTGRRYTGTVRCRASVGSGIWTQFSSVI